MKKPKSWVPKISKIVYKFTLPIVLFDSLATILISVVFLFNSIQEMNKTFENKVETYTSILKISIMEPLWNLDSKQITTVCEAISVDRDIVYLKILDTFGNQKALIDNLYKVPESSNNKFVSLDIVKDGLKLGNERFAVTDYFMKTGLKDEIINITLTLLFSIVVCIFAAVFVIGKKVASPILSVAGKLTEIATNEEVDLDQKIDIISNDEVGELAKSFNQILEKSKQQLEIIDRKNKIIIEQEKLASLGTLIGGIAHNLKTPIFTILATIEGLRKLLDESNKNFLTKEVTNSEQQRIVNEMKLRLDRINLQAVYMSDVIKVVREQFSNQSQDFTKFDMRDVCQRITMLLLPELKKHNCTLNTIFEFDGNAYVYGDAGNFVQIPSNLIVNSIQAYEGKGGRIDIIIQKSDRKIIIKIIDFAGGIPQKIKEKLFKDMVTTKGKEGSGIGIYVSYAVIKGKLNGDMKIDSEEGIGTTVTLEMNQYQEVRSV